MSATVVVEATRRGVTNAHISSSLFILLIADHLWGVC